MMMMQRQSIVFAAAAADDDDGIIVATPHSVLCYRVRLYTLLGVRLFLAAPESYVCYVCR